MINKQLKLFLSIMATLMVCTANAQVQLFDNTPCSNSVARSMGNGNSLVYNQLSPLQGCFILTGSKYGSRFDLPASMLVNDFEVDDAGRAWFCGSMMDTPVIGMFDVAATFAGTDVVHYALCTGNDQFVAPGTFSRMDIRIINDTVVMALVGEAFPGNDTSIPLGSVTAAYMTPSFNQWKGFMNYDKTQLIRYTDIVALDNLFVAFGTDSSATGCYAKPFKMYSDFPHLPCLPNTVHKLSSPLNHEGAVLADMLDSSVATIADRNCFYTWPDITFSPVVGPVTLTTTCN